jgi:hypothetical protein
MSDAERPDILVQRVEITIANDLPAIKRLVVHAHTFEGQSLTIPFDEDALSILVQAVQAALLAKTGRPRLQ